MKSTLINSTDLNNILKIKELIQNYPNDMELGSRVRALLWESLPHFPTNEQKKEWNKNDK
jgi:hypothetical protein